jgi:hypothetical protein
MPQVEARLYDNESDAISHANSVVNSLDLSDVLNPKRLVQVVHPNQVHSADTMYLVITPQDTETLVAKRNAIRAEASEKIAKLEAQLAAIRQNHGWTSDSIADEE